MKIKQKFKEIDLFCKDKKPFDLYNDNYINEWMNGMKNAKRVTKLIISITFYYAVTIDFYFIIFLHDFNALPFYIIKNK